jgi:squalene-hopene/tetraprenyl-beta-curcumene cyclase
MSPSEALSQVCDRLVALMNPQGFWEGHLSSSALSTATAITALALANDPADVRRIKAGLVWLAGNQNKDGGWGDTIDSPSNLASTLLAVAAITLARNATALSPFVRNTEEKAREYLAHRDATTAQTIVTAVRREYGEDRTFAVPILMNCALADMVAWSDVPGLPFELAVFPHRFYQILRLHVVSYALPALIAIGMLIARRNPTANPLRRTIQNAVATRVLEKLEHLQPEHGGFLEATPLTSFVAMGMIALFGREQPVAARCLKFLRQSQREEGAWPIDTNLSVWLTTGAVTSLASAGGLSRIHRARTAQWIAAQQYTQVHPYTQAAPGGWGWTHLPGGVPDIDDTSGAIVALAALGYRESIKAGLFWLLQLQNSDGGWPTFCRGWGKLPFDRSSPDLTAHALRALSCARANTAPRAIRHAMQRGLDYLNRVQQEDGSWLPLWFGNQATPEKANPVIGTARVLRALEIYDSEGQAAARGVQYLLRSQNLDGGWGGAPGVSSSMEETALAVAALSPWAQSAPTREALTQGIDFLVEGVDHSLDWPTPIGLYFSHLWYSEQLYPLLWTIDALGRAVKAIESPASFAGPGTSF